MSAAKSRAVATDRAPAAIGPYSQALSAGDWLFCSGQIPLDPRTGALVEGGFEEQAAQVFDNLRAVLDAAGLDFGDVVKVTVYMTDLDRFGVLNELYAERFGEPYPARAVVGVASLPKGAPLEVELVAKRRK